MSWCSRKWRGLRICDATHRKCGPAVFVPTAFLRQNSCMQRNAATARLGAKSQEAAGWKGRLTSEMFVLSIGESPVLSTYSRFPECLAANHCLHEQLTGLGQEAFCFVLQALGCCTDHRNSHTISKRTLYAFLGCLLSKRVLRRAHRTPIAGAAKQGGAVAPPDPAVCSIAHARRQNRITAASNSWPLFYLSLAAQLLALQVWSASNPKPDDQR